MRYLALVTPLLNRRSLHIVCRNLLAEISPPALISAVSAICCSSDPLSFSEQWEKNKDGEEKIHSIQIQLCHPYMVLGHPTQLTLGLSRNSLQQLSSSDRRSAQKRVEQGEEEKSIWLWNRKQWEMLGERSEDFVMEGWCVHGETTVILVPGLDVNLRATKMTAGLFVWGINF